MRKGFVYRDASRMWILLLGRCATRCITIVVISWSLDNGMRMYIRKQIAQNGFDHVIVIAWIQDAVIARLILIIGRQLNAQLAESIRGSIRTQQGVLQDLTLANTLLVPRWRYIQQVRSDNFRCGRLQL